MDKMPLHLDAKDYNAVNYPLEIRRRMDIK